MSQGAEQGLAGKDFLIALGTNATSDLGDLREIIESALGALRERFETELTVSNLYRTPAFPEGSGPDFVNAACRLTANLDAADVLATLHQVEDAFGRTREVRWGQRSLDLDLIAAGEDVRPDLPTFQHWRDLPIEAQKTKAPEQLILPHPRLQDRAFVLVPLADIAADWCHPVLGQTVAQMLAACPAADIAEIVPLTPASEP